MTPLPSVKRGRVVEQKNLWRAPIGTVRGTKVQLQLPLQRPHQQEVFSWDFILHFAAWALLQLFASSPSLCYIHLFKVLKLLRKTSAVVMLTLPGLFVHLQPFRLCPTCCFSVHVKGLEKIQGQNPLHCWKIHASAEMTSTLFSRWPPCRLNQLHFSWSGGLGKDTGNPMEHNPLHCGSLRHRVRLLIEASNSSDSERSSCSRLSFFCCVLKCLSLSQLRKSNEFELALHRHLQATFCLYLNFHRLLCEWGGSN